MMKHHLLSAIVLLSLFLGVKDGYLALLRNDTSKPVAVYPMRACMLPKQDQLALSEGIPIHSTDQLNRLLEDYLS